LIFLSPTLSSRSIFNEALTKLPEPQRVVEIQAVIGLTKHFHARQTASRTAKSETLADIPQIYEVHFVCPTRECQRSEL